MSSPLGIDMYKLAVVVVVEVADVNTVFDTSTNTPKFPPSSSFVPSILNGLTMSVIPCTISHNHSCCACIDCLI